MSGASPVRAPSCRRCGLTLEAVAAGRTAVEHGTVAGQLLGPVAWSCPADEDGHDRVGPTTEDGSRALAEQTVVADATWLRGRLRCRECGTPFTLPGRRTTRSVTVTSAAAPPVTIALDVPMLRCTEDAVDNLPPESATDADAVLGALLDQATSAERPS